MSPGLRRFLPLILVALLLLVVVPSIFKKHSGPSRSTKEQQTLGALATIDKGQQKLFKTTGRYSSHLADFFAKGNGLATAYALPLVIDLGASANGKRYVVQIESDQYSLVRSRESGKLLADQCLARSGSGSKCPVPAAK